MSSANRSLDEASRWIVRLDRPDCPHSVQSEFERWLLEDPRNRAAYLEMKQVWDRTDCLQIRKPLPGHAPPAKDERTGSHRRPRRWWAAGLAAAISLVFMLGWMSWPDSRGMDSVAWEVFQTGVGEIEQIPLVDGSRVHLNTDSTLHVRYTDSAREIRLSQGEAVFKVAPDAARPFEVAAGQSVARAIGTEFAVRLIGEHAVSVAVTEGQVLFGEVPRFRLPLLGHRLAEPSLLVDGQVAVASSHGVAVRQADRKDLTDQLAWRRGDIVLGGERLEDVVSQFNRYNTRQMIIRDQRIADLRIGGRFQAADLENFVCALDQSFGVVAIPVEESDAVWLKRRQTAGSRDSFDCGQPDPGAFDE